MHFIGYLIYGVVIASYFFAPAVTSLINMSVDLATEIAVACIVIAFYPPLYFLYLHIFGKKDKVSYERLCSVSQTSGNTVVSLGLIGTFVGLTDMIGKIAGAIGGEGGSIDEQIALIMVAIGESLNAMSFAFLTSVMGVAGSVVIFAATIYFKMFFDKTSKDDAENISDEAMEARIAAIEEDNQKIRRFMNRVINANIDRKELASIVISNTLQVKALSEAAGKLATSIESQCESNQDVTTGLKELKETVAKMEQNQEAMMKFEAGSYKTLAQMSEMTSQMTESEKARSEKTNKVIEAIAQGLTTLKS
ncbi:hypothetical protein OTK49_01165 [Vibrio coralliirubri]|uniref:hypothetical protein n=1 Tax=Vibrio coralliirubri TaxID=1516159 RepID=UPI002283F192|nr:hypothetical protein [Vibrio coralliirubri]MCY9861139.1 hypothetical protein [Vibrio coralliirubri]